MKFSKKGRTKIGEFMYNFQRCVVSPYAKVITPLKFESDDFEDCVVLTIDEFKKIVDQLSAYSDFYYEQTGAVNKEITLLFLDLFEKLKKAEKDHASN